MLDLFLSVLERDAEREAARWETGSVADVLAGLAAEDPDWATVVVEQSRRRRTDPGFRARWSHRTNLVRDALRTLLQRERAAGRVAPTIPDEVAARFISVVGDGLLRQRAILGEVPHAEEVIALATTPSAAGWVRPDPTPNLPPHPDHRGTCLLPTRPRGVPSRPDPCGACLLPTHRGACLSPTRPLWACLTPASPWAVPRWGSVARGRVGCSALSTAPGPAPLAVAVTPLG